MTKRSQDEHSREFHRGTLTHELSLSAMLNDEIVRLVMARDGVTASDIRALAQIVPLVRHARRAEWTV